MKIKLAIYQLAKIIPKQKNLWVFGAWKGEKYSDNCKYLFEFVTKNHPEIEAIWITRNINTYKLVKGKGYNVRYSSSLAGIWACMRARVAIVCTGASDLPSFAIGHGTIWVNLWHGLGPKDYVRRANAYSPESIYLNPPINLVVTTSKLGVKKMQKAFGSQAHKIEILGYPRHDSLVGVTKKEASHDVRVFYAPTHRSESQGEVIVKIDELYNALCEHPKIKFITKLHDLAVVTNEKLDLLQKLPNFELLTEAQIAQDVYTVLPTMDLLITDYSSIYTDFLLLERPIIFVPFDKDEYKNNDQGFFMDYDLITPGPKAKNWVDVMEYIETYKTWESSYLKDQKRVVDLFHEVRDGHSCERITKRIMSIS